MSCNLRSFILGIKWSRLMKKTNSCYARYLTTTDKSVEKGPFFIAAQASVGFCNAALVTEKGKIVKLTVEATKVYQSGIFYEMSTNNIWEAMLCCIKRLTNNVNYKNFKGIGFVATSALVCLDKDGNPVTSSASRDPNINCILSIDRRSLLETDKINKTRHARLHYFGDKVSPELQESKILWLKNNLREDCWYKVGHFIDLSDFLTWKATGSFVRSLSVLLSKWSYEATVNNQEGWNSGFFTEIGMPELTEDNFSKLGSVVQRSGTPVANGLLSDVAAVTGLPSGLPVATSMSENLAGGLGIIGCQVNQFDNDVTTRLCIVYGPRSSSHFTVSHDPVFIKGIWGPFKDGIFPGMWLNEAGQTTAKSAMDFVINQHSAVPQINKHLGTLGHMHIHKYLNKILKLRAQKYKLSARSFLTKDIHVLPDFNGNQSPLADPLIRGMVCGLTLTNSQESLALLYLATMQSLAYSTRHIISAITQYGQPIKSIIIGGSLAKNSLFIYLHKDVCQLPTITPEESRCKLIGAAILGAMASNYFRTFNEAVHEMCGLGKVLMPDTNKELLEYHNKKYQIFLKLYEHQLEYRRIMDTGDVRYLAEVNPK